MTIQNRIIFLLGSFFLCALGVNAQVTQINWKEPITVLDTNFKVKEVPYFDGAKIQKDLFPYFTIVLSNVAAENFRLVNPVYASVSEKENSILQNKNIPTGIIVKKGVQNRRVETKVSFVPLRMNAQSGVYEKLISFSYEYDQGDFVIPQNNSAKKKPSYSGFSNAKTTATGTSVLSSGSWYKLAVTGDGLQKLDYNFLKSIGINPDAIDPRNIKIYGNGIGMLPQSNNASRPDDLIENSIFVSGENDGNFDAGDYVLFYAKGPNTWVYNTSEGIFNHTKNLYSDKSYYFITVGSTNGLRIQDQADLGSAAQTLDYYNAYTFYENDQYNFLSSGREWFGDIFSDNLTNSYSFNTTGIMPGSLIKLTSSVLGKSNSTNSFTTSINGTTLGTQIVNAIPSSQYPLQGVVKRTVYSLNSTTIGNPSSVTVALTYNKGSSFSSVGYLDYLELNFRKRLALYGNQTSFRNAASTGTATTTYTVNNASSATIWQVTDLANIKKQQFSLAGSTASFSVNSSTLEEYVIFSGNDFPSPEFVGGVANQDLHGIDAPNLPDMVIVTHPDFVSQANQLANFRQNHDGLSVQVVTTEQVYNEFSSGAQDVTAIRDFMKMLFDRKSGTDSLRYLLLFGDCSYDYKNRVANNTNFVPVYESYESLAPLSSFSSDDYFGMLDDTDGAWSENPADEDKMEIGIGRLPVKNAEEASAVVDKLIHYSSSSATMGKWRNVLTFVSDDGDGNLHIKDANDLSTLVETTYPVYNINKVFLDAFTQSASPGGEKAPDVNNRIDLDVNAGTFILNYSGHGGETGWAQEGILGIPQIESWTNYDKMPFMITATCDFGRYDDPLLVSGAETSLLRSGGGSIGVITSARVVYAFTNRELNIAIYENIFKPLSDGKMPRLGDVIRLSKNTDEAIYDVNNRNFALLGDPSLRLAYPANSSVVTQIKGIAVSPVPDTLKALSKVSITGEVRNSLGAKLTTFNGTLNITVYDKKVMINTNGTEGGPVFTFPLRNSFLFDGNATVTNGDWSISFVVPKDISYQYDFGKISTYASKEGTLNDAAGYYSNIIIGGTDPSAPSDNTPPRIRMFMNDESFVFGGLTDENALFLAKLSDENGINTAGSGIGHEIAATLDGNEKPVVLNSFYTANLNDYQNGTVKYPFKDLATGPHTIKLKVWDTYNNSAESTLEFVVASDEKIALSHILNYPNPFSTHTVFHFDHNRVGEELDVMIQVYTISGKLVKTLDTKVFSSGAHFSGLDWDGRDDFGDKIGKGVYVYRVWVRSARDGSAVHKYEKLVLLN